MKKLFEDFQFVSYEAWMKKIEIDLKGKPLEVLTSQPEPDLNIVAYHHLGNSTTTQDNGVARNLAKLDNDWKIRQVFNETDDNKSILSALNNGVNAIGLQIDSQSYFNQLTKDVLFDYIHCDVKLSAKSIATSFSVHHSVVLNFDTIGINAISGNENLTLGDYYDFYLAHSENATIWVSGSMYGASGASTVQELAFTLAHLNEYIQFLYDKGETLATINDKISIELSVNDNYFVNISKFRVIHDLIHLLFKGYDENYEVKAPTIFAKTNIRHMAKNDKNNNPLRETTQAMSAVIGGCDILTVEHGRVGSQNEVERFERIAKNIQLILKEEAYLGKVVDPSGGSYYIESLSQQLLEKSWQLFLTIEKDGGLEDCLKKNIIQTKIGDNKVKLIDNMLKNKSTFLGVNKHPNGMEEWMNNATVAIKGSHEFEPLSPFFLEDHYSKTVAHHE